MKLTCEIKGTLQKTTATAILYHLPIIERDTIMGGPSPTKGVLRSQIEFEGHHLSPSTKSDHERYHIEQQATYLTNPATTSEAVHATTTTRTHQKHSTAGVSQRSHIRQSSPLLQPIQGHSRV